MKKYIYKSCAFSNHSSVPSISNQLSKNTVVVAISGGYLGLFLLFKIKSALSGSSEEEAPAVAAAPASSAGEIPDVDSEEFGAFLESEENVAKLVGSFEK